MELVLIESLFARADYNSHDLFLKSDIGEVSCGLCLQYVT